MKRGQITLFVILGVIIIGAISLGLYFRQQIVSSQTLKEVAETSELPPELESLREDIQECANTVSDEALYFVGQQGGYFLAPDNSIQVEDTAIAYGVQNGVKTLVSEDVFKSEVRSYIEAFLPGCVDYSPYTDFGIFDQTPLTTVNLTDDGTNLEIDYKVSAQKGENAYNLFEPYEVELPLKVKNVYEASSKIADDIASSPEEFDIAKILSYGMDVQLENLGSNVIVVNVKDRAVESNYEFQFGVAL